jgi:predicted O-methyltransferase YrrM
MIELTDPDAFGRGYLADFDGILDRFLPRNPAHVLEWGAGYSTARLVSRLDQMGCRLFVTIDDNSEYLGKIMHTIGERSWLRALVANRVGPMANQSDPELAYSTMPLRFGLKFDFIYIDGRRRLECAFISALLAHRDSLVVLHDYRRGRYQPVRALFDIIEDGPAFRVMRLRAELIDSFEKRGREIMHELQENNGLDSVGPVA